MTQILGDLLDISLKLQRKIWQFGFIPFFGLELEFYLETVPGGCLGDKLRENNNKAAIELQIQNFSRNLREKYAIDLVAERGPYQFECRSLPNADIVRLADELAFMRKNIAVVAQEFGLYANFAPKPYSNHYGSSLQINVSLHKVDYKVDITKESELLQDFKHEYVANSVFNVFSPGQTRDNPVLALAVDRILANLNASLYLVTHDDPAQFQRFVPGFMAPTHVTWGVNNRTTALRIPNRGASPLDRRIELRVPGANACIYRSLLLLLPGLVESAAELASWQGKEVQFQYSRPIYEPIYGNAYEPYYQATPLANSNKQAANLFKLDVILDRLLA